MTPVKYVENNTSRFVMDLKEFLSIPSVSTDPQYASGIQKAASWLCRHLERIGIKKTEVVSTNIHPIVYGEHIVDLNLPTILFYGHYDVQPVDPLELWESNPFTPRIRNGSIYARGATDDKGQLFIILKAVESFIQSGQDLPVNLKFVFEGEEETGSNSIPDFLKAHKDRLSANVAVICDSAMIAPNVPTIIYGLKGFVGAEVILRGSNKDLHSGVYGGGVDNPVNALCWLLSSVKDREGKITIPGFYDQVIELGVDEKKLFTEIPFDSNKLLTDLGLSTFKTEEGYTYLESSTARPTFDINGISGGYQGEGFKAIIPSFASAKISMRIVPDQDPAEVFSRLKEFLENNTPKSMTVEVLGQGTAWPAVVDLDNPGLEAASRAMQEIMGHKTIFMRDGGSLPIVTYLKNILGLDSILMGFGLKSDAPHAPNENFGLDRFSIGIHSLIKFLQLYPQYYKEKALFVKTSID